MKQALYLRLSKLIPDAYAACESVHSKWPLNKYLISFCAGGLGALALTPYHWLFCAFLSYSLLLILLWKSCGLKQGFAIGWSFGFGYFLLGLSWIANALLIEGNPYIWAWPLAAAGLPAVLALFFGLTGGALNSWPVFKRTKPAFFIGFIVLLSLAEFLRGHIFTGFPWNLAAHIWADTLPILQGLSLFGLYALSFLTLIWCALPGFVALTRARYKALPVLGVLLFCALYAWGMNRIEHQPLTQTDYNIHIIQANIQQSEKWQGHLAWPHFEQRLLLSYQALQTKSQPDAPHILIWPETAIPAQLRQSPVAKAAIQALIRSHPETTLVSGTLRASKDDTGNRYYTNSLEVFGSSEDAPPYNKYHLVPFGEYIPFSKYIPLDTITGFQGFSSGDKPLPVRLKSKASILIPLICYEAIFPELSRYASSTLEKDERQDALIVNVTNDSWYGKSAGPYQHLAIAKFRAIENGISMIRSADTGFSAVIDPFGRILDISSLYDVETLYEPHPGNILQPPPYTHIKNGAYWLLMETFMLIFYYKSFMKEKNTRDD